MGEQILIAEDDADINNLLAKILRTEHFKPIQAFSGTEAKLLFMHNTYQTIIYPITSFVSAVLLQCLVFCFHSDYYLQGQYVIEC